MGYLSRELLVAFVMLCAFVSPVAGQTTYTITDLGGLSGTKFANATSINDSGQIVGISADHAFLWENGVLTDLGTLGGGLSAANSINNRGQGAGETNTVSGKMDGFLWEHGDITDIGSPGETSSSQGSKDKGEIGNLGTLPRAVKSGGGSQAVAANRHG